MDKIIIGIFGRARSGKNTFANMIEKVCVNKYGYSVQQVSFAEPVKYGLARLIGTSVAELENAKENNGKVNGIDVRKALQEVPTALRKQNDSLYVDIITNIINKSEHDVIIVTDGRFPIEADLLTDRGAYLVKLFRYTILTGDISKHVSETSLDNIPEDMFFSVVNNNKLLGNLNSKAEKLMDNIINNKEKL